MGRCEYGRADVEQPALPPVDLRYQQDYGRTPLDGVNIHRRLIETHLIVVWRSDYVLPTAYAGPTVTLLPSSTVNSTHVNAIFRCQVLCLLYPPHSRADDWSRTVLCGKEVPLGRGT